MKDVRNGVETSNVESVLDRGEPDPFIDAELRRRKREKKQAAASPRRTRSS